MKNLFTIQGWRCYGLCKPRRTDWSRAFVPPGAKTFEDYRDRTNYSEEDYEPLLPSSNGIVQKFFIQFIALLYYPCQHIFSSSSCHKNKALLCFSHFFNSVWSFIFKYSCLLKDDRQIHQNQTLYQQGVESCCFLFKNSCVI